MIDALPHQQMKALHIEDESIDGKGIMSNHFLWRIGFHACASDQV
jgi:hypothetical protein